MSLRVCRECSAVYAVGLSVCPQCGEDDAFNRYEWEVHVPKVSDDGLSTNLIDPTTGEMDGARFSLHAPAGIESEETTPEPTEPEDAAPVQEPVAVDLDAPSAEEQGDPEPPEVQDSTAEGAPEEVTEPRLEPPGDQAEPAPVVTDETAPGQVELANEYANQAKAAFEKGDYAEALSQLDLAAEFDPSREARWDSLRKRVSDAMQGSGWDG